MLASTTHPSPATLNGGKTRARVRYSYTPKHEDELELKVDAVVEVIGEGEEGWLKGRLPSGKTGLFPTNFCEFSAAEDHQPPLPSTGLNSSSEDPLAGEGPGGAKTGEIQPKKVKGVNILGPTDAISNVKLRSAAQRTSASGDELSPTQRSSNPNGTARLNPPPPSAASAKEEWAKVGYAYKAQNEDELELKEGDIIRIINKDSEDPGWWYGELRGKKGVFPDNFVSLLPTTDSTPSSRLPGTATSGAAQSPPAVPTKPKPPAKMGAPLVPAKTTASPAALSSASTNPSFAAKRDNLNSLFAKPRPPSMPADVSALALGGKKKDESMEEETSAANLSHPNLSRPKQTGKRPPSKIFLKEMGVKEESTPPTTPPQPPSQPQPPFPKASLPTTAAKSDSSSTSSTITPSAGSTTPNSQALQRLRSDFDAYKKETDARMKEMEERLKKLEALAKSS